MTKEIDERAAKTLTLKEVQNAILGMERRGKNRDFEWFCWSLPDARRRTVSTALRRLVERNEIQMDWEEYIM